jgi:hypothetical protein
MKLIPLTPEERAQTLATHKVLITYADTTPAAATQTIQIFPRGSSTAPAGTTVRFAGLRLNTPFTFSDGGITSCLVEVGDGGDTDRFLTQTEIISGSSVTYKTSAATSQPYSYDSADGIDAKFTASGGGSPLMSESTAGSVSLFLHITTLNDPNASV